MDIEAMARRAMEQYTGKSAEGKDIQHFTKEIQTEMAQIEQRHPAYWKQEEKVDYCSLANRDKDMRAYVRQSGCINLLFYDSAWEFEHDRHTYDWHICEIDEAIAMLQAIKEQATAYFKQKGVTWPDA